jgi:hypothetical protein
VTRRRNRLGSSITLTPIDGWCSTVSDISRTARLRTPSPGCCSTNSEDLDLPCPRHGSRLRVILANAKQAGGKIVLPAARAARGGMCGAFADPDGYVWEVAHNPGWIITDDGSIRIQPAPRRDPARWSGESNGMVQRNRR